MTNETTLTIWGREFLLPVHYDCFEDESVTPAQERALRAFLSDTVQIENSKQQVELYCRDEVNNDDENTKKDNVFSYIKPDYLYVTREEPHSRVAIMCNYRYDLEHGLAVIFSQDNHVIVSEQDAIL